MNSLHSSTTGPNCSVSFPGPFLELRFVFPFVMITAPPMPQLWNTQICTGKRSKGHEAIMQWSFQTRAQPTLSCSSGPGRNSTLTNLNACFKARMCSLGFAFFTYIILYHPSGCFWTPCVFTETLYSSCAHHVHFRNAVNALHLHINAHRNWWPCMGTERGMRSKNPCF